MIRIFTKGKELVLNRDTTLIAELNNALFAHLLKSRYNLIWKIRTI